MFRLERSTKLVGPILFTLKVAAAGGEIVSTKGKSDPRIASDASNGTRTFTSTGEGFADCAMIELVSSSSGLNKPNLLLWNGRKATVAPCVQHADCIYEAPVMDPVLYREGSENPQTQQ